MDLQKNNFNSFAKGQQPTEVYSVPTTFVSNVFSWMCLALGITAFIAYYFSADKSLMSYLISVNPKPEEWE